MARDDKSLVKKKGGNKRLQEACVYKFKCTKCSKKFGANSFYALENHKKFNCKRDAADAAATEPVAVNEEEVDAAAD
nr:hypothetical protein [Tanacetum cinerariifolium]